MSKVNLVALRVVDDKKVIGSVIKIVLSSV